MSPGGDKMAKYPKTIIILQPEDRGLLKAIARADGDTTFSSVIRRMIRAEAEQRGLQPIIAGRDESKQAYQVEATI
jgi:hypothetical protein